MYTNELDRDHHRLRLGLVVAAAVLLAVFLVVLVRTGRTEWRLLQKEYQSLKGNDVGDTLEIRQYFTCAQKVERCPTCHLRILRTDLTAKEAELPFRSHGPGLRNHRPDMVGCSCCHGGNGRALTTETAHARDGRGEKDPLMGEPHLQASCARCHVPGAKEGQERLVQGAWLYLGLGCTICHPLSQDGRGGWDYGPDLTAVGRRDLEYLETSLIDPTANFPGSTMPSFRLALEKEPEATVSLLVYLESLVLERFPDCGDRQKSQGMVPYSCTACHAGQGGRAGGRMKHRCLYLLERAEELRCFPCHDAGVPEQGPGKGFCPLVKRHREACAACHDGA